MDAQGDRRADHAGYIAAVRRGLEARDIRVTKVLLATSSDGRREATVLCHGDEADESAFAEPVPGMASMSWDEENGWSLSVRRGSLTSQVHKGLDVVPDPGDVAAWAAVLLAHPELTPSRDDHPFRDHHVPDPVFEALLAAYPPAG
jgi:hypothetical protein